MAGDVVTATADGNEQVIVAGEGDGLHHIVGRQALGNQGRPAIDHGVPDLTSLLIGGLSGKEQ